MVVQRRGKFRLLEPSARDDKLACAVSSMCSAASRCTARLLMQQHLHAQIQIASGDEGDVRPSDWLKLRLGGLMGMQQDTWDDAWRPPASIQAFTMALFLSLGVVTDRLIEVGLGDSFALMSAVTAAIWAGVYELGRTQQKGYRLTREEQEELDELQIDFTGDTRLSPHHHRRHRAPKLIGHTFYRLPQAKPVHRLGGGCTTYLCLCLGENTRPRRLVSRGSISPESAEWWDVPFSGWAAVVALTCGSLTCASLTCASLTCGPLCRLCGGEAGGQAIGPHAHQRVHRRLQVPVWEVPHV